MTEAEFMSRAKIGAGGDDKLFAETLVEFLRSRALFDLASTTHLHFESASERAMTMFMELSHGERAEGIYIIERTLKVAEEQDSGRAIVHLKDAFEKMTKL